MNREIKFQAYLPTLGIMIEEFSLYPDGMLGIDSGTLNDQLEEKGFTIDDSGDIYKKGDDKNMLLNIMCGDEWYWIDDKHIKLRQYSTITDKDGKELYDESIIRDEETGGIYIVKFGQVPLLHYTGYYCQSVSKENRIISLNNDADSDRNSKITEIGNTYQNPEINRLGLKVGEEIEFNFFGQAVAKGKFVSMDGDLIYYETTYDSQFGEEHTGKINHGNAAHLIKK